MVYDYTVFSDLSNFLRHFVVKSIKDDLMTIKQIIDHFFYFAFSLGNSGQCPVL